MGAGRNKDSIDRLIRRLAWFTPLIVFLATAATAVSFYWVQARPMIDADMSARQAEAADRVMIAAQSLVDQVEHDLRIVEDMNRAGLIGLDDPAAFARVMIPLLQRNMVISGAILASDSGRELFLVRRDGDWKSRQTDLPARGRLAHWRSWSDTAQPTGESWVEQDYDPRTRPWFTGAMGLPEAEIHWTAPYLFFTAQAPGLTVSTRLTEPGSGRSLVLALDVLLLDLSRQSAGMRFGQDGRVAILTEDGKVLGLPRDSRFGTDEARRGALLQDPASLGMATLDAALRLSRDQKIRRGQVIIPAAVSEDGRAWIASLHPLPLRGRDLTVVTLAPQSEFRSVSNRLILLLTGGIAAITLAALIATRGLVGAVNRPIAALFRDMERNRREIETRMLRRTAIGDISRRLQQAQTPAELARTLLSELAVRLELGQALFCLWDETRDGLVALARYGGPGRTAEAVAPPGSPLGGLLAQCARDRRPIEIEAPGTGYVRVVSGLGDAEPAAILIVPVGYAGRLFGVIELAGLRPFTADERDLLAEIEPVAAMSLDILQKTERASPSGMLAPPSPAAP